MRGLATNIICSLAAEGIMSESDALGEVYALQRPRRLFGGGADAGPFGSSVGSNPGDTT